MPASPVIHARRPQLLLLLSAASRVSRQNGVWAVQDHLQWIGRQDVQSRISSVDALQSLWNDDSLLLQQLLLLLMLPICPRSPSSGVASR